MDPVHAEHNKKSWKPVLESDTGALGTISRPSVCRCHQEFLKWLSSDVGSCSEPTSRDVQHGAMSKLQYGESSASRAGSHLELKIVIRDMQGKGPTPPIHFGQYSNRWTDGQRSRIYSTAFSAVSMSQPRSVPMAPQFQ